jgi:hypothetical protein
VCEGTDFALARPVKSLTFKVKFFKYSKQILNKHRDVSYSEQEVKKTG